MREGATQIGFWSETYGDADAIDIDCSDWAKATLRVEGTIDGYVKGRRCPRKRPLRGLSEL